MPFKDPEARRVYIREWQRKRAARYTAEERAKRIAAAADYRAANPDYFKRKRQENRKRNKELQKAWIARNYTAHRKHQNEKEREARARDPERFRAKDAERRANGKYKPGSNRPYGARRRARLRNAGGEGMSLSEWRQLIAAYEGRCVYCDQETELTIEHVIPLSRGGMHDMSNIVPACSTCNKSKGAKLLDEWRPPKLRSA